MATSEFRNWCTDAEVLFKSMIGEITSISNVSLAFKYLRDKLDIFPGYKCLSALDILHNMINMDITRKNMSPKDFCKMLVQHSSPMDIIEFFDISKDLFDSIRKSDKHKFYETDMENNINLKNCVDVLMGCQRFILAVYVHARDFFRTQGRSYIVYQIKQKKMYAEKTILLLQCRVHAEYIVNSPEESSLNMAGVYKLYRQMSLDVTKAGKTAATLPFEDQKEDLLWTKLRSCRSVDDLKLEDPDSSCPVCMEASLDEDFVIVDGCRHIFCRSCAETLYYIMSDTLKKECPLCRTSVGLWTTKKYYEAFSELDTPTVLRVNPVSFEVQKVSL